MKDTIIREVLEKDNSSLARVIRQVLLEIGVPKVGTAYADPELDKKVLECAPNGVDYAVEVEFGENINIIPKIMRAMGTVSIYGSGKNMNPKFPFGEYLFKSLTLNVILVYIMPMSVRKRLIKIIHDAYINNALSPSIDSIYELGDCAKAHEQVMKPGRNGTVLLKID